MEADPLAVIPYLSASVQLDHNYHQMMSIEHEMSSIKKKSFIWTLAV
jgi:hypothetical protein